MKISAFSITLLYTLSLVTSVSGEEDSPGPYGVDVSFPMHHKSVSNNYQWLPHNVDPSMETPDEYKDMVVQPLGDKQTFYDEMIQGCVDFYGNRGNRCLSTETDRVEMSLRQPKGVYNYTKLGYTKIRAPDKVFQLIKDFWEVNRNNEAPEQWNPGNTYVNHWSTPTYMVNVENQTLKNGGFVLKQHIWNTARDTISEWTGQQLRECSLYGIRVYKEGAVLATHVDRLPLVSSAIINVDQDVDEPWPLEVIGHDGVAVNVTMEPGDLVLYESHSILHGRPFPLKGRFMANIFIHFEPVGPVGEEIKVDRDLPKYVIRGSEQEAEWKKFNPNGYKLMETKIITPGHTQIHAAAVSSKPEELRDIVNSYAESINARDQNGWTPLHEAVRAGRADSMEVLLEHGADMNARTYVQGGGASGGTPLWYAMKYHGKDHEATKLLEKQGAIKLGPGLRDEL